MSHFPAFQRSCHFKAAHLPMIGLKASLIEAPSPKIKHGKPQKEVHRSRSLSTTTFQYQGLSKKGAGAGSGSAVRV